MNAPAPPARPPACDPGALHVLAYARGFTHWYHRTPLALDRVAAAGYFTPVDHLLRPGDRITVCVHRDNGFRATGDFCVLASSPVRVAAMAAAAPAA